jgi:hypothetical protein
MKDFKPTATRKTPQENPRGVVTVAIGNERLERLAGFCLKNSISRTSCIKQMIDYILNEGGG